MLDARGLSRTVGRRKLVDAATLSVAKGEIASLMGPSGGGKTSLLRMLIGLDPVDAGQVEMDGVSLAGVPPEARGMSMVFQEFTLFPHLNVLDNVRFGLNGRASDVTPILEMLEIDGLSRRRIDRLSGGEQQRVALARSLAVAPRLLLLDEPFSNIDHMLRDRLYGRFKTYLRSAGIAALIATHDHREAFFFSDRVHVMRAGRVLASDTPEGIYHRPANRWVAEFFGLANVLEHDLFGAGLQNGYHLWRPEWLEIGEAGVPGTVHDIVYRGAYRDVRISLGEADLWVQLPGAAPLETGARVSVRPRPGARPHPMEDGE